ncbi:MAG: MFS transporter [Anaerolineales bacterium]|nr:MFS transporter [Anaerolineales bacterium]
MKKLGLLQMLALNFYWIGMSFKWNALHPIILPAVLLNYTPDDQKNTYLGLLTFAGLLIAMIVQPVAGAVSDSWASRWGRRRPLILLGTLFDFVFLALLGWAGGLTWLVIGYICLQFSSNVAHGPAQGLLPDKAPPGQMGVASGLKTFLDMLALIAASLAAGRLLDPSGKDPSRVILVVMVVIAVSTAVTLLGTPEEPSDRQEKRVSPLADLRNHFRIDFRKNTSYWWLIASRFSFLLGIYGIQSFSFNFISDVMNVENPVQVAGDMMAVLAIGLVLLALAGGWLSDRLGAGRILLAACLMTACGCLLIPLAENISRLTLFAGIVGAGAGLFLTANWALASRLAPVEQTGKFLGLTNLATAGSAALARLVEGPALDWLNNAWPGQWVGYTAMFLFGVVCALVSAMLLGKVRAAV